MNVARRRARSGNRLVLLAAASALGASGTFAASGTWATANNGNWSNTTATGWNQASVPNGIDETAAFSADLTGDRTITNDITGGITLGGIAFSDPSASNTWIISGSNAITLDVSAGSASIAANTSNGRLDAAVTINDTAALSANASRTLTINGAIGDGGAGNSLTINAGAQTGNVTLSGANTFGGGITLTTGTLEARNNGSTNVVNALGTGTLTLNGGTLNLRANGSAANQVINVIGSGGSANNNVVVGANATISADRTGGSNTGSTFALGTLSLGGNTLTLNSGNGYAVSFGATTLTGNATITNAASATLASIGEDASARNFTKSGAGLLAVTGATTYSGTTTISGGALRANSISAANLTLNGGVLELGSGYGTFTRSLGSGSGQVQFGSGGGGFSAFGGDATANIGGAGGTLQFGGASFVANDKSLLLSSAFSDSTVTLQNGLDLNGRYRAINVGQGSAAVDAVITGTISGTNTNSGLVKFGQGTLRLDMTNTYAGGTLVQQGTLIANATNAIPNWVGVMGGDPGDLNGGPKAAYLQADVANAIGGGVFVAAGGALRVKNIDPSRIEVLPGGGLAYDAAADLPVTLGTRQRGTNLIANYAMDQGFVDRVASSYSGTVALGADSSSALDLSGKSNVRLGAWDTVALYNSTKVITYSGTLTPDGSTYRLGGGNAELKLTTALTGSGKGLDVGMGADAFATTVQQNYNRKAMILPGRVTLTANNNYTGATNIGPYALTKLEGTAGAISGTSAININGGQLYLRDATGATNNDRLSDSAPIAFNRGGVLRFDGNSSSQTENIGSVSLNSGQAYIVTGRTAFSSGTPVLTLAGLTRTKGATANFVTGYNNTTSTINITGTPALAGWALVGLGTDANYAKYSGMSVVASSSSADYNTGAETTWNTGKTAVQIGANTTLTGSRTINNLKSTATATLNLGGFALTANQGGFIMSGGTLTIQNGTLTAGASTGSDYELFLAAGNGHTMTINATIADNGANPVTLVRSSYANYTNGDWTLNLSGNNTYSGGTYLNWGNTSVNTDTGFGTGAVYAVGYGQTDVNNWSSFPRATQISAGGTGTRAVANDLYANSDVQLNGAMVWNGQVNLANGSGLILGSSSSLTVAGKITGDGYVRVENQTAATFFGGTLANDYTGPTYVTSTNGNVFYLNKPAGVDAIPAGGLVIGGIQGNEVGFANYASKIVQIQASNQINDAATVTFVGGVGNQAYLRLDRYNETIAGLNSVIGAGVVENGNATAANVSTLTVNGSGTYAFGGVLQNGGTAKLNLVKAGAGTQILNGANTYTGTTTITGGTLVVNGSLASPTVTINGGGLGGSGTVSGAVSITGPATFSPGNSAGTLTLAGALPLASDSTLQFELNGADTTVGSGVNDLMTGVTDLNLAGTLNIDALASFASVTGSERWTLIQYSGNLTGPGLVLGSIPTLPGGGSFAIDTSTAGQVDLVVVVPEPSTFMAVGGVIFGALSLRRRARVMR